MDAAVANLPEYLKRIRALEKANAELEARLCKIEELTGVHLNAGSTEEAVSGDG
jgi:hypothetical protein